MKDGIVMKVSMNAQGQKLRNGLVIAVETGGIRYKDQENAPISRIRIPSDVETSRSPLPPFALSQKLNCWISSLSDVMFASRVNEILPMVIHSFGRVLMSFKSSMRISHVEKNG